MYRIDRSSDYSCIFTPNAGTESKGVEISILFLLRPNWFELQDENKRISPFILFSIKRKSEEIQRDVRVIDSKKSIKKILIKIFICL